MEPIRWKTKNVIDSHVHFEHNQPFQHFYDNADLANCTKYAVLGLPFLAEQNDWLLEIKRAQPKRFFIFGRLFHDPAKVARGDGGYLVEQVEHLMHAGFDGVKMWEGKPVQRKTVVPWPFDHAYYRPYWEYMAARGVPVTVHQGDVATCWNPAKPRENYADGASFESYIREAEAVLAAHPKLRISFAHFLWLSPWLDRLDRMFRAYPEMRIDLAMGSEYLHCLSNAPAEGRQFFTTWQHRILYGTDINDNNSFRMTHGKAEMLRLFLETDEEFENLTALAQGLEPPVLHGRSTFRGLNLPPDVLENVMARNFEEFAGAEPKPVP